MVTVCAKVALRPRRVAELVFRDFTIYDGKKVGNVIRNPTTVTTHFDLQLKEFVFSQNEENYMHGHISLRQYAYSPTYNKTVQLK